MDRIEGKIYFAKHKDDCSYDYIFKSNATNGYTAYIVLHEDGSDDNFAKINSGSSFIWDNDWDVRDATELERQWFELCYKKNKFMLKPELKEDNYEIY